MECGGKRSATPLWLLFGVPPLGACYEGDRVRLKAELQTKAPSPLRSAGALQILNPELRKCSF